MQKEEKANKLLNRALDILYDDNLLKYEEALDKFDTLARKIVIRGKVDIEKRREELKESD